jgi:hypothetical protein
MQRSCQWQDSGLQIIAVRVVSPPPLQNQFIGSKATCGCRWHARQFTTGLNGPLAHTLIQFPCAGKPLHDRIAKRWRPALKTQNCRPIAYQLIHAD